jgi:predicted Zn-dependent peptidase
LKLTYHKTTLANGLRVLSSTLPHTYSVGVGFYISIGSRYEQPAAAGAAHFIEHMLFKGTERRPAPQAIALEIEGHGGLFNASTGQEMTVLWAKMQQAHLPLALDVLADMLRHSLLVPDEVEKERRVILEEISSSQDIPEELVSLALHQVTWPDHPLGWDVAGTPDSVQSQSRESLCQFLLRHYGPLNTVISVAGAVDHSQVVELADRLLGDWQGAAAPGYMAAPGNHAGPQVALINKKVEQTHLALHLPGLPRDHSDRFALNLLNVILGEGMSSRLFLEIRERLGLAYAVDSYISQLADTGVTGVYAAVAPDRALEALSAILAQLQRLCDEVVDEATLHSAKEFVTGRLLLGLEDTMAVSGWFGRQEALTSEALSVEQVIEQVAAVDAATLQRVARQLFQSGHNQLAIVGPHRRRDEARFKALLTNGPLARRAASPLS